ncbi:MAG: GxxExxY protein [Waddliaceae bacterium]|nr:GxxExxY protein [Waddliaceae bacterium]|tara:strand:- start:87 stop:470 length:384 start_codon:yes stop_codon:yes gene_type:complete
MKVKTQKDSLTEQIIGAAIQVHTELGPGLLESIYEACLFHELSIQGLKVERQKSVPITYKGIKLGVGYRLDLFVEDKVIIEIKSVAGLLPIHEAQLISYLKQMGGGKGLLINFNVSLLKNGLRRFIL